MPIKNSNAGAALAAMRAIESKQCVVCGEEIKGLKSKKYCTEKCKQKAKYERNKEEFNERKNV